MTASCAPRPSWWHTWCNTCGLGYVGTPDRCVARPSGCARATNALAYMPGGNTTCSAPAMRSGHAIVGLSSSPARVLGNNTRWCDTLHTPTTAQRRPYFELPHPHTHDNMCVPTCQRHRFRGCVCATNLAAAHECLAQPVGLAGAGLTGHRSSLCVRLELAVLGQRAVSSDVLGRPRVPTECV